MCNLNTKDPYDRFIGYRLKRLYLLRNQAIDEALKVHGLARSQWQVLYHVNKAGELAQKDLQSTMRVESATLTRIVDSLVRKGWLQRSESPVDKRVKILRLTNNGHDRWNAIPRPMEIVERQMLHGIDAESRKLLKDGIEQMIKNLEALR